jgi:hypothetical protein
LKATEINFLFYKSTGLPINPEDIIISTGGSEALLLQWVAQWIKEMR